jgi:anaphase-promoting complex subunit 4
MLAIASSDHLVRLIDVWTGKVVHRLSTISHSTSALTSSRPSLGHESRTSCLAYASTASTPFSNPLKRSKPHDVDIPQNLEDLLGLDSSETSKAGLKGRVRPDLPRELAMLDVESSLPKLSILPATGGEYVSFTSAFDAGLSSFST